MNHSGHTDANPRVVVIGGEGFYGSRVVEVLRARGYDVAVAGRPPVNTRKAVAVDLSDPTTFGALAGFDVIVAIANSVSAPSDALVSFVERNDMTLVEASAFAPFYRRTLARPPSESGRVLLGAGVFPGYSTQLACRAASRVDALERVDVAVRLSPLSGSGWGNALLMARMLALPSFEWVDGARVERPTVGRVRRFAFETGTFEAAQVDLPDVELVHEATGAPSVTTWMSLSPSILMLGFRVVAWVVAHAWLLRRPLLAVLHWQLALLRGLVLRDRTTPVEIVAVATGPDGAEVSEQVRFEDGFAATAEGVADAVEQVQGLPSGRHVVGVAGPSNKLPGEAN